jgi:hypothetical protein
MQLPQIRKYPREVRVKDETYQVKFVRKIKGERSTLGECDPESRTIRIKLGQSLAETFATFIHEVLHAIEFEYEIKISHRAIYLYEKGIADLLLANVFDLLIHPTSPVMVMVWMFIMTLNLAQRGLEAGDFTAQLYVFVERVCVCTEKVCYIEVQVFFRKLLEHVFYGLGVNT